MTTEQILTGNILIDENPTRKELQDLLFSLHGVKLTENNVDNIIYFINYCKQDKGVMDYVTWYLLYLIDNMQNEDLACTKKVILANKEIADQIRGRVVKQGKERNYPDDAWNSGWTKKPLDEVRKMKGEWPPKRDDQGWNDYIEENWDGKVPYSEYCDPPPKNPINYADYIADAMEKPKNK